MAARNIATPESDDIEAPIHSGDGEFLMNITIGTPPVPFTAIMDTGSDLIWTQCNPCINCFHQDTPLFDPKKSSTCSNVSCSSELCKDTNVFKCNNNECNFVYTYGDESSTQGFMAKETLTFVDSNKNPVSIPNVGFGCGVNNQEQGLVQSSGLVGLGRGSLSLVSQLGVRKFSYCLTLIGDNKSSSLLFGSLADLNLTTSINSSSSISGAIQSTPLVQNPTYPSFYYVTLEGISVGETLLPISKDLFKLKQDGKGGMIIDSGTTLTYIPEDAFDALKKEFTSQMKLKVSRSDSTGLDLCFELPSESYTAVDVPKMKFHFNGLDLDLPSQNYMITDLREGVVCLAMAASSSISIFGNIQQQNMLVLHDLEMESLSFLQTQCDQV